ncbi:MAG: hypothetical protein Q9167_008078 [Letrouitia subvulpina]
MADASSFVQQLDAQLEKLFAGYNIYTTLILIGIFTYLVYPLFFSKDPDTHPFLLARQSSASFVRQPGESAIFRSLETPHGYPLRSGLNVKDPGAPKWSSGKDGDLRDVWRKAVQGPTSDDGKSSGLPGKVLTVLGKTEIVEHKLEDMSKEINALGHFMKQFRDPRVAIYLPNSAELFVSLFASAFYGFTAILIPQEQSLKDLGEILASTKANTLVTAAGSVPLQALLEQHSGLREVIWVVERTSRHMEWNEVPEGVGGRADIGVWHEVIEERRHIVDSNLPSDLNDDNLSNIVMVSNNRTGGPNDFDIVEFTQQNLVAAISAQTSALPRLHRLSPSDTLTPLASLSLIFPLTISLAALYSNASLALTSVSGDSAAYDAAFRGGTRPTIVIASSPTIKAAAQKLKDAPKSVVQRYRHWQQARSLATGVMPPTIDPSKPRLIYTFEQSSNPSAQLLSSKEMGDMRVLTGARMVYAFTDPRVAGAISQSNIFDYRIQEEAHFGVPLSCVEVKLVDAEEGKNSDEKAVGALVVTGPAVAGGGEVRLEKVMAVTEENTLAYA